MYNFSPIETEIRMFRSKLKLFLLANFWKQSWSAFRRAKKLETVKILVLFLRIVEALTLIHSVNK